jgi:hypothetical protein
MPGEQRIRFDVEAKPLWRTLGRDGGLLLGERPVVGGVDLDEREARGVEAQALLRAHRPARIPVGVADQRLVGPRARPDQYRVPVEIERGADAGLLRVLLVSQHALNIIPSRATLSPSKRSTSGALLKSSSTGSASRRRAMKASVCSASSSERSWMAWRSFSLTVMRRLTVPAVLAFREAGPGVRTYLAHQ